MNAVCIVCFYHKSDEVFNLNEMQWRDTPMTFTNQINLIQNNITNKTQLNNKPEISQLTMNRNLLYEFPK